MEKACHPKILTIFAGLLIFFQLFQIFYFERGFFLQPYDAIYWQDRFEHSQWRLPLSERIVGDDGLYGYVGYRLALGASPDFANAETPPFGKYLIGLSIRIFHNPVWPTLFLGLGSLLLFYIFVRRLTNGLTALVATTLLFLEPLFFSQLWKAWLDIGQLFFLLANLVFLLRSNGIRSFPSPVLAGFFLGLFAVSKMPFLLPLIFGLETIYFWVKRLGRDYLIFCGGMILAVLIVYGPYFASGHSLADFLGLQKYMLGFYRQSQLTTHVGAVWQVLLAGRFPDISSGIFGPVAEWWLWWPILGVAAVIMALKTFLTKGVSLIWQGLGLFILLGLLAYTFIPIYPRYLLIIWPFLILLAVRFLMLIATKKAVVLGGVILLAGFGRAAVFLWPDPEPLVNNFYYNLEHQYFQDIYEEDLAKESRPAGNREEFRQLAQGVLGQATVKAIEVTEKTSSIPRFGNEGQIKLSVTYKTLDLGPFTEEKAVKLVKEGDQWRVVWDWDLLLNGFRPGDRLETTTILGKRGTIFNNQGKVLVQDSLGDLISVKPSEIDPQREEAMLKLISNLSGLGGVVLYNAYQENILPGALVPLASLAPPDPATRKSLLSYPGLVLTKYPVRVYNDFSLTDIENTFYDECCTRIYSRYSYRGVKGPEKQFDDLLAGHDGGKIVMKNEKGETVRIILEKEAKNGQNVVLSTVK